MTGINGKIESVEKGITSANSDLTLSTLVEVNMAKNSLPDSISIDNSIQTAVNFQHGHSPRRGHSPEYTAYQNAKTRCTNRNKAGWDCYGGRGIEFRFTSFVEFFAEVGTRPSAAHSLDRIDNNGHYESGNVRWATVEQQVTNTRHNRNLIFNGETLTLCEWAKKLGCSRQTIGTRLRLGWCVPCALSLPISTGGMNGCAHRDKRARLAK